jgi:hypothetical protein
MSGVIVIAKRTKAAKDILSGTIHKLTFWRDDVRRKAVMRLLLRQKLVDGMAGGSHIAHNASHLYSIKCAWRSLAGKNDLFRRIRYSFDDRTSEKKRTAISERSARKCPSMGSFMPNE